MCSLTRAKRENAITALERLLRVTRAHETREWVEKYGQILGALREQRDEEAIAMARQWGTQRGQWDESRKLAEDVDTAMTRLRSLGGIWT